MVKIFYDWEFEEDGKIIKPITLGMFLRPGVSLYLANSDYDQATAPEWIKQNVLPYIEVPTKPIWVREHELGDHILEFVQSITNEKVELVAYYADYDHVRLAQCFGSMVGMPDVLPWVTYDLKQWIDDLGGVKLPDQSTTEHNALADAEWNYNAYQWLTENYEHPHWMPELRKKRAIAPVITNR
jgi:hypothetical protein